MIYISLIKGLLENIGGKNNIIQVRSNVTRIIFILKDNSIVNVPKLNKVTGIYKVIFIEGQLNIVIGNKVKDIFEELLIYINKGNSVKQNDIKKITSKDNFLKRYMKDIECDIRINYNSR